MASTQDPFQIPKAGLEIAPLAGLASINVNGSVGPVPATEFLVSQPSAAWWSTPSTRLSSRSYALKRCVGVGNCIEQHKFSW